MSSRSCSTILVVIVLALAVGAACWLSPDLPELPSLPGLPEISITLPVVDVDWSLPEMPTLEPLIENMPTFAAMQTSAPLATPTITVTPTPAPPPNGRLLYLGLDQQVWSVDALGANPVLLGRVADFHVYANQPWYDHLGRYALVTRKEAEVEVIYLTSVSDPNRAVRLGPVQRDFDFTGLHDFFAFASDSKRFLFIDASTNPANLFVIDLETLQSFSFPIQASVEEVSFASFLGDSSRIVIKSYDPNLNAHYLELYDVGAGGLSNPRRMLALDGHRIEQFAPSPDGHFMAVVFRNYDPAAPQDRLFVYDLQQANARAVIDQAAVKILLPGPAWSPDSRYLMANSWTSSETSVFNLVAYDTQQTTSYLLLDSLPSLTPGEPFVRVATFAPDKLGAGLYVYEARPGGVDYWTVLLDGSYRRQVTQGTVQNDQTEGEYVSAITADWTRLLVVSPDAGAQMGTLYVAALDGSRRERLDGPVPYRFFELGPVISPDGKSAAYLRLDLASQQAQLCAINLDGSGFRVLFSGAQIDPAAGGAPAGLPLVWLPGARP